MTQGINIPGLNGFGDIQGLIGNFGGGFDFGNNNQQALNFNNFLNSDRCSLQSPPESSIQIFSRTGEDARLFPVVNEGKILGAFIQNGGENYNQFRDVVNIKDSGRGQGASLKLVTNNRGSIIGVNVIRPGNGYSGIPIDKNPVQNDIVIPIIRDISIINVGKNYQEPKLKIPNQITEEANQSTVIQLNGRIIVAQINFPFIGFFGRYPKIIDSQNQGYGASVRINYSFVLLSELRPTIDKSQTPIILSKNCPI